MSRVALASSRTYIDDDEELPLIATALSRLGLDVCCLPWDDPTADWADHDLVVIRSCWDYPARHAQFLAWARQVPGLANPYPAIAWNIDKRYLQALARDRIRIPPTVWEPVTAGQLGRCGDWVVKPTVSANGKDTHRVSTPQEVLDLVSRLHSRGRQAMVQPYLQEIDTYGELSLIYIDGVRSHAIRKPPALHRNGYNDGLRPGGQDQVADIAPELWAAGDQALQAVRRLASPGYELLYARIDLIPRPAEAPVVMEAEIIEPFLFLPTCPQAADTLAAAILRRLHRPGI
jgi:glutathione synthase/RimK-type ligase-like ATP-grasp enzyme